MTPANGMKKALPIVWKIIKKVFINTLGDVSALRFKTNQIRKMPEVTAGIHNKTNNIPTIEAQFKEALIIKKKRVYPTNFRSAVNK